MLYKARATPWQRYCLVIMELMGNVGTLVLVFCATIFYVQGLNCRVDGGPKEEELKGIYMTCLKHQNGRNSSDRNNSDEHSSREKRKQSQNNKWRKEDAFGSRDEGFGGREDWSGGDWSKYRDRTPSHDNWGNSRDMSNRNERTGSRDRNNMNRDRMGGNNRDTGRDDFMETDDYGGGDMYRSSNNGYRSSTQSSRRSKRERSSGHRSQYNPNASQKSSGSENSYQKNDKNSHDNNSSRADEAGKACALHCFLEELEMTGDTGMPDRYLVTQVVTKDVRDEDLRDFLQESIEECFQMLYNENTQDKCEFSKNLLLCLSEKGRANCDDWKEDFKI